MRAELAHSTASLQRVLYGLTVLAGIIQPMADASMALSSCGCPADEPDDLEHVLMPYGQVSCLHLPLLKKFDVKRLTVTFGEPQIPAVP
jgi:hypothetical protein